MKRTIILTISILLCCYFALAQEQVISKQKDGCKANYVQAEELRLLTTGSPFATYSLEVVPNYINNTDRFWYFFENEEGNNYYLVDPKKKSHQLLFENEKLVMKISEITKKAYSSKELKITPQFSTKDNEFEFCFDNKLFSYYLESGEVVQKAENCKTNNGTESVEKHSSDNEYLLYAKNHNLFIESSITGNSKEIQMTSDGERYNSLSINDSHILQEERTMSNAEWMKKGNRFYAIRIDRRKVKDQWIIDALAKPRPTLEAYKQELAGDSEIGQYELLVGDVDTKTIKSIDVKRWKDQSLKVIYTSNDGKRLYMQRFNRYFNQYDISVVDIENGDVKVIIEESEEPYIDYTLSNVHVLNDGKEFLVRSEKTGWGHYYLYDVNGQIKHAITSGSWVAGAIHNIDEAQRRVYFTAYGIDKEIDPYYELFCYANIDKRSDIKVLTSEDSHHKVSLSPTCSYFVDSYSRVDKEPVNVLRSSKNGKVILKLSQPDINNLYSLGWKKPERFKVKAADGKTDLYGVMWKPFDFDSLKHYPIISSVYPGPHTEHVPTTFTINGGANSHLAQVGFIVVAMGHRGGTNVRGKEYHTYGYGNMRDYPLADDKFGLEQLIKRHNFIDGNRIGIIGSSGGGFMAAASLLSYPNFYRAGVSASGNHDNNLYSRQWVEAQFSLTEELIETTDSVKQVDSTRFISNTKTTLELANNYKGGLLLVTGDMDKTVHLAHTFKLADALIKARKQFKLVLIPGAGHGFKGDSQMFYEHKVWFHFAKHLLDDHSADTMGDINYFMNR